jgi:hypothetical protein
MASLKALKIRIGSVKSTQKITKALNMVAASKLRRAQQNATAARPYSSRMIDVVGSLAGRITPGPPSPKLHAGTNGFIDNVDVKDVTRYEAAMLSYLRSEAKDVLKTIRDTKALDDDTAKKLKDALTAFGKQFA